jgi:hypothetical protein
MTNQIEEQNKTATHHPVWSMMGATAVIAMAALVIMSVPDVKRYIRISTM